MINVYDFDNTIYDWETSVDFFVFCVKKYPFLIKYAPKIIWITFLHKLNFLKRDILEETSTIIGDLLKQWGKINNNDMINEFYNKHKKKIKAEIFSNLTSDDCIISASPRFILEKMIEDLPIKKENLICSEFSNKWKLLFACYWENKTKAYTKKYGEHKIDSFYTDSKSDTPMFGLSKNIFLVKWNKIKKLPK